MKRIHLASISAAALVALVSTAHAADMPVKARGPAPAPAVALFNWTGFYAGIHGGYGWGNSDWVDLNGNFGAPVTFDNLKGWMGGGQLGFNWQTGLWVFGVEATLSGGSIDQATTAGIARVTTDVDRMATAVGRLGYAVGSSLIYVKGGYATARVEITGDNGVSTFKASERHNGWTVGAGWEFAVMQNASFGVEYNYYDFGRDTLSATTTPGGQSLVIGVDAHVHSVLARLNFRFATGKAPAPAPIVAKN